VVRQHFQLSWKCWRTINIKSRQAEGITAARLKGKYIGRPEIQYPDKLIKKHVSEEKQFR
jgi:DNA invertase Pin-like site-specific DNA recombinase